MSDETGDSQERYREKLCQVVRADGRYGVEACYFLFDALHYTQQKLERETHVTGQELSEGIRDYALEQFGMMALAVFESWGISKTDDFGEIVYLLIAHSLMSKTEEDSKEDFSGIYDFQEAFQESFEIRPSGE